MKVMSFFGFWKNCFRLGLVLFMVLSCKSASMKESTKTLTEVTTGVVASVVVDSTKTTSNEQQVVVTSEKELIDNYTLVVKAIDENGELKTIRQEEYSRHKKETNDSTSFYKNKYEAMLSYMYSLQQAYHHNENKNEEHKQTKTKPLFFIEVWLVAVVLFLITFAIYVFRRNR